MAINNQELRYKIEVEDIQSYVLRIPVSITANFIVNEVVNGDDSGASAVVVENTALIDGYIKIRNRSGFFYTLEGLTGSVSGIASKTGETEDTSELYDNVGLGISGGLWTLLSDEDLLTDIRNPNSKINILDGGGLSSGDSFGFNVTNQILSTIIQQDGLYFRGRKVMFYIGLVNASITTWHQWWTGVIETIRATSDLEVEFSCADLVTQIKEKVGSKEIPICLNKNYNCKLVFGKSTESAYFSQITGGDFIIDNAVVQVDVVNKRIKFLFYNSGAWAIGAVDNFENSILEITMGGGAGNSYRILGTEFISSLSSSDEYWIYVDGDVSDLIDSVFVVGGSGTKDVSLAQIVPYQNHYNLSQNEVQKIHTSINSKNEKPLVLVDEEIKYNLSSPDVYEDIVNAEGVQTIKLKSLDSSEKLRLLGSEPMGQNELNNPIYVKSTNSSSEISTYRADITFTFSDFEKMIELSKIGSSNYLYFDSIRFDDALLLPTTLVSAVFSMKLKANYKSQISFSSYIDLIEPIAGENVVVNVDGLDLIYRFDLLFERAFELMTMKYTKSSSAISSFSFDITITTTVPVSPFITILNPFPATGFDSISGLAFKYFSDSSISKMSIGCNGENVQVGNEIETVTDTIDYMLTEYYDKTSGDIDSASFNQAEIDFNIFPNNPVRNLAHQIIDQNQGNTLLSDMLITHHLGMFPAQDGRFRLENWLPKSIVFSQSSTDIDYTETGANRFTYLSPIIEGDVTKVYSDMQLNFNLNESTGNYDSTIRIKRTDLNTFDFDLCTEGVDSSEYQQAFSCWQSLKAGRNRINRDSQTVIDNKYIKTDFSDGTGTSEALSFILGLSGFRNRAVPFGKVHVPINETNLSNELLSFVGIEDQFITDGILRKSWIVERELNIEESRIEYKIAYDIHPFDIFIYRVNIWSDGNNPTNVKTDGNNPGNVKTNGLGI